MLGPKVTPGDFTPDELTPEWELYEDDNGQKGTADAPPEELKRTPEVNNKYVNADIMLTRGSEMLRGRVTGRKHDRDGNTAARASENQILDTWEYTAQLIAREVNELTANIIAQSMYAQCDPDRNQYLFLDEIINFCKTDTALFIEDQKIVVKGRASMSRSTVGWKVCCQCKYGLTSWEILKDPKESHPVDTA